MKITQNEKRLVIALAIVMIVGAVAWISPFASGGTNNSSSTTSAPIPASWPNPTLVNRAEDRQAVTLGGKTTVVEFYALWCPYCAYDSKWVVPSVSKTVMADGGSFIGVDASNLVGIGVPGPLGNPEGGQDGAAVLPSAQSEVSTSLRQIAKYQRTFHLNFPMYFDENGTVASKLGLQGYPYYVFVDSRGRIVKTLTGVQTARQLLSAFDYAKTH